ncbi:nuclear transport factor 2 family protein [Actinoplanes bogorensis]|uniref:Nuclear transport factor 2 family protein n=1 Tax=Paractinoplanes bogorensis TaxID=1610840 RepID=A0ABS5YNI6_9ACTN|nr:nuclear transport factor 2 family protein [Actinoplanes bogorensis]MBU2665021.1 nuclear transport factor 2 family protein [Actinoplanes bogorensis]
MDQLDEPIQRLLDVSNAGDTAAFLAAFTPDGVVDDWGREFRGASAIRGWSDNEFIGKQVSLEVVSVSRAGDETTVLATVGGNGFNGPSHFTFQVEGDRVSRMTIRE